MRTATTRRTRSGEPAATGEVEPVASTTPREIEVILQRFSVAAWTALAAGVVVSIMYAARGARLAAAETAVMVVAIETARRWTSARPDGGRLVVGTHLWIAAGAVTMVANAVTVGQDQAVTMWFFCAVPMIIAYICSIRAATQWLPVTWAAFVVVYALPSIADVHQEIVPGPSERLLAQVVMATSLYWFGVSQRQTATRHVGVIREQADALEHARDAAVDASRAKSAFLANMSHELRTPLHGIVASLDLLRRDTSLTPSAQHRLDMALVSVAHARRAVDDILDFTRIEAGSVALDEVTFRVREVVQQAVDVVASVAEQKRISVHVDIAPDVPPVAHGDAVKLRRVLVNLLGNAVKFTDRGRVSLRVRWSDGRGVFEVDDTGVGIDRRVQERVFEQFEQGDTSTTRRFGGTGLGLPISRELTKMMHGDLRLDSEPERGTTVTLSIPLEIGHDGDLTAVLPPLVAAPRELEPSLEVRGTPDRPLVLVVDDNATNSLLAGDMLEEIGCRSIWAPDGATALELLAARGDVSALLLDSHLPGMPGDEVAVRTRQRYPLVRIVVLSADVSVENFNRARAAGADCCLGKPARVVDVRRALHETGVLPARFEVARLERAYDLVTRGDAAGRGEAEDLIRAVYRDAAEFTESLRDDPATEWLFASAHRNLSGSLVYAADLAAADPGSERSRQLLLQCLSSAINWEDT